MLYLGTFTTYKTVGRCHGHLHFTTLTPPREQRSRKPDGEVECPWILCRKVPPWSSFRDLSVTRDPPDLEFSGRFDGYEFLILFLIPLDGIFLALAILIARLWPNSSPLMHRLRRSIPSFFCIRSRPPVDKKLDAANLMDPLCPGPRLSLGSSSPPLLRPTIVPKSFPSRDWLSLCKVGW